MFLDKYRISIRCQGGDPIADSHHNQIARRKILRAGSYGDGQQKEREPSAGRNRGRARSIMGERIEIHREFSK
jgi:hypothetical protein